MTELTHCVLCVLLVPLSLLYSSTILYTYSECNEIALGTVSTIAVNCIIIKIHRPLG